MYDDYDGSSSEDIILCASPLGRYKTSGNSCGGSESSSSQDDDRDGSLHSSSTDHLDIFDSFDPGDEKDYDTSCNGYKFYEEKSFPAGVNDVVHVGLAELCHKMKFCIGLKLLKCRVTYFLQMHHNITPSLPV